MITKDKWKWHGAPGHFVGGNQCGFHLLTEIGDYLVSTIGDWYPLGEGSLRMSLGQKDEYYETKVFKKSKRVCDCGCRQPISIPTELDGERGTTAGDAANSHNKYCMKYARGQRLNGRRNAK